MPVPVVTCGADQPLAYDGSPRTISLTATATESPTVYQWLMLDVPPGSSADTGTNGDFTNGESFVQNPDFDIDGAVDGTYVLQCRATNASGQSNPATDKASGQTSIVVATPDALIQIPSDFQYDWGRKYLNPTLRLLESSGAKVKVSSNDTTRNYLLSKLSAGTGITLVEQNDGANETIQVSATGSAADEKVGVTGNDTTPGYLDDKLIIAAGNALTKAEINDGGDEDLSLDLNIDNLTLKGSPVAGDMLLLEDSADSFNQKKVNFSALGGGGGSSTVYSAQVSVTLGTETFTVAAMAANTNVPGNFDLHYCAVNGIIYKIVTTVPGIRECRVTSSTTIEVANLNIGNDVEFLFGEA